MIVDSKNIVRAVAAVLAVAPVAAVEAVAAVVVAVAGAELQRSHFCNKIVFVPDKIFKPGETNTLAVYKNSLITDKDFYSIWPRKLDICSCL